MLSQQSMNTEQRVTTQKRGSQAELLDFQSKLGSKGSKSQRTICPAWKQAPAFHAAISPSPQLLWLTLKLSGQGSFKKQPKDLLSHFLRGTQGGAHALLS